MNFNVNGTGRLGKDAELTNFENGNSVLEFSVASNEFYKDKNGELQKNTDWHDIKLFGKDFSNEFVAKLVKGTEVAIIGGDLKYNNYEKDDVKHSRAYVKIRMSNLSICGSASSSIDVEPEQAAEPKKTTKSKKADKK